MSSKPIKQKTSVVVKDSTVTFEAEVAKATVDSHDHDESTTTNVQLTMDFLRVKNELREAMDKLARFGGASLGSSSNIVSNTLSSICQPLAQVADEANCNDNNLGVTPSYSFATDATNFNDLGKMFVKQKVDETEMVSNDGNSLLNTKDSQAVETQNKKDKDKDKKSCQSKLCSSSSCSSSSSAVTSDGDALDANKEGDICQKFSLATKTASDDLIESIYNKHATLVKLIQCSEMIKKELSEQDINNLLKHLNNYFEKLLVQLGNKCIQETDVEDAQEKLIEKCAQLIDNIKVSHVRRKKLAEDTEEREQKLKKYEQTGHFVDASFPLPSSKENNENVSETNEKSVFAFDPSKINFDGMQGIDFGVKCAEQTQFLSDKESEAASKKMVNAFESAKDRYLAWKVSAEEKEEEDVVDEGDVTLEPKDNKDAKDTKDTTGTKENADMLALATSSALKVKKTKRGAAHKKSLSKEDFMKQNKILKK